MKLRILVLLVIIQVSAFMAYAQTTEFTYQGSLKDGSFLASGSYDFEFRLFDVQVGGTQQGPTIQAFTVQVTNGIFTQGLNFGNQFPGTSRFLNIAVRPAGAGTYTQLAPRQPITSTPYAIRSTNSTIADTATTATNALNLGGVAASQYVVTTDSRLSDERSPTAGSTNYIQNTTALQASSNFNISGNGYVGGNLGIGTTAPQSKLTIQTPTHNYGFLQTDGAITFGSFVGGTSAPIGGWFGTKTNHPLHFFTNNGTARMTIANYGFVGIGTTTPTSLLDVRGDTTAISGITTTNGNSTGVFGKGFQGVRGESLRTQNSSAVYGDNNGSNTVGYAGFFDGRVAVLGNLTKSGGSFKIDHPLDPANKYLSHSFVESPDMMNIYNGNTTTDERGEVVVTMPEYFGALNRDFRYQLTVIGQFAQAIVAEEIKNNSFVIRTDKPNVKISWMVTGIRQDAYANENRILVEEDKPATERGLYLYPKGFNQPAEKSIVKSRDLLRARQK